MQAKTLWISDLDGTLLNRDKQITSYTKEVINKAVEEGLQFSVATARTPATVVTLLEGLSLSAPVVVMNGAAIYNINKGTYEEVNYLGTEMANVIENVLKENQQSAFVYCIEDNQLIAYHGDFNHPVEQRFYDERQNKPQKIFKHETVAHKEKVLYFVMMGDQEKIHTIYEALKDYDGLSQVYYEDIYEKGVYYLEVYSHLVSKANAIKTLKRDYGYEEIVCFGDNYNDIEMFELADYGYAVENAVEKIKELSTAIIGHHNESGVARFIEGNWQKY
ncbi:Cof-type HAD-IIB family hydrolase [Niameybacter massiliensis]|uniref:Cof-type HAD-IIB family hydrolase n=1 Tax=Niameybacter massiliensis TaxID=1658108 RepID=UPI0006B53884|nr:Cof-type HAD-IIB family hydrolase [Niameybacter massiliensis]